MTRRPAVSATITTERACRPQGTSQAQPVAWPRGVDREFRSGGDGQRSGGRLHTGLAEQEAGKHRVGERKGQSVLARDREERERFGDRDAESAQFLRRQRRGKTELLQRRPKLLRRRAVGEGLARSVGQEIAQHPGGRRAQHAARRLGVRRLGFC